MVHLLLVALFVLMPRAPAPETAPAEPGIAMQFERPRPEGAASDAPQSHAGQGTEAPTASPVQSEAPGTPSPQPLAPAPPAPEAPPGPAPPDAPRPDAPPLQHPPVPPPPGLAPDEAAPPETEALPDVPPPDAPVAPLPEAATPPAPAPAPTQPSAPETPDADVQVNAGPLASLFDFQPIPVPVPQPRPMPAPEPRPRAARPAPGFPTPRQWAFTPAAPGGGSPARGGSRGLNLSFAPRIRGGGGSRPSSDFSAPDAGPDWENELHAWWDRHSYYPREAAEAGEQGTLGLHLVVNHAGLVIAARLTGRSGSVWLDQGALALFRDAHLPPLPPQTAKPEIPVDLTIRYSLIN